MKGLSKIGAAAHAPFIAAADLQLLGMQSWQELANPRDIAKQFDATDYMAWRSFRASNDSRYMALTLPRFLGRPLYGANSEPVEEFAFEEDTDGGQHDNYLWLNASYALGVRITEAFKTYGWCTRIRGVESGGTVEDLPTAMFPTDDGAPGRQVPDRDRHLRPPRSGAVQGRPDGPDPSEKYRSGHLHRRSDPARAEGLRGRRRPRPAPTSRRACPTSSPAAASPHYLKCMVRDWIGSSREAPALTNDLQSWIMRYVDMQPDFSTEEDKARKPLKSASVDVIPDPENPGYYRGVFRMVPHYQLEGMDVSLSMVFAPAQERELVISNHFS
ncbi:type VI secretion system contractile sheath domain-containing protein [Caulobacter segnis]